MSKIREFEEWWESDGKYCRAGGGDYERTFAHEAWQAASATLAQQPAAVAQEPVAWGAFQCSGKRAGKLYGHADTEAMIEAYILDVHRSNDSLTLRKGPLHTAPPAAEQPAGTTSDQYRAELYDEVWQEARALGFGNVTEALSALARQQLDEKPDASAQLASIEAMCAMIEAREWADHAGVGEIGKRVESAISTLRNGLQEAQRTAMAEQPDTVKVPRELLADMCSLDHDTRIQAERRLLALLA